jgi:palmitoyltransferase
MNYPILARLTLYTIALILVYLDLQGSDPGYLTNDVMSRLDMYETTYHHQSHVDGDDRECKTDDDDAERRAFIVRPTPQSPPPPATPRALAHPSNMKQCPHYPHTRRKYCERCRHPPPLRSHHCNVCDGCVSTFDHHCHFLDTCIGERNHFRFWTFVLLNVICFHVALDIVDSGGRILSILSHMYDDGTGRGGDDARMGGRIGMAMLVLSKLYMYPLYCIVVPLWTIHTILAFGNSTTFEMTKGPEHLDYLVGTGATDFPFGNGLLYNMRTFVRRDDIYGRIVACFGRRGQLSSPERWRCCGRRRGATAGPNEIDEKTTTSDEWVPISWTMPRSVDGDSTDWWNHPWKNKYWSCC